MGRKNLKTMVNLMECAIGIDLGGTSIKYALVDVNGNCLLKGQLPSWPLYLPMLYWVSWRKRQS